MKSYLFLTTALLLLLILAPASFTQQSTSTQPSANTQGVDVDRIVRAFASKETEFRQALNNYAFKRDAVVQSIGFGGQITGEYHRVSTFTFDDKGNRYEKINYFPLPTFEGQVTPEDLEDLGGVTPFALEASKLSQYNFTYSGKERIDELNLYVFDVAPKVMPDPKKTKDRFFVGRIWVDDHDLQIVKAKGKAVPETKNNKFPVVETYREQIDGRYWFPTYAFADDVLDFDGQPFHVRLRVKYTDFVKARGTLVVRDVDPNGPGIEDAPMLPPSSALKMPIDGGLLNGEALEMPRPEYRGVKGTVTVRVLVNEEGIVIKAEAIDGPAALRDAAVAAALKARFEPRRLSGQVVKVSGTLKYEFKP